VDIFFSAPPFLPRDFLRSPISESTRILFCPFLLCGLTLGACGIYLAIFHSQPCTFHLVVCGPVFDLVLSPVFRSNLPFSSQPSLFESKESPLLPFPWVSSQTSLFSYLPFVTRGGSTPFVFFFIRLCCASVSALPLCLLSSVGLPAPWEPLFCRRHYASFFLFATRDL